MAALHYACEEGQVDSAALLILEGGADVLLGTREVQLFSFGLWVETLSRAN